MIRISSNARRIADRYAARRRAMAGAVEQGLRAIGMAVNREQVRNLSGSGSAPAGSYPVPVRKGHLRRSADWRLGVGLHRFVEVLNSAEYARVIHRDRPFLTDAGKSVDANAVLSRYVQKVLLA